MLVAELIERLQKADPNALVLLWAIDPNDPNKDGYFPLTAVEIEDAAFVTVSAKEKRWMTSDYHPEDAVPAVWLE
jgi:hypothetical protein